MRTEDIAAGRPIFDAGSQSSKDNANSFEIPETPEATDQRPCPTPPLVVRVMGRRLDETQLQYLVLCWMYPQEDEAAYTTLNRHCRDYDEKISRGLAQQKRLSTLRSWKHFRARDRENSSLARKRLKTNTTVSASQNHTSISCQGVENLFLDPDVCLVASELSVCQEVEGLLDGSKDELR